MHKKLPWLKNAVLILGRKTLLAVDKSIQALLTNDIQLATEVRQLERLVDSMYHGINE
ncbi:PhoU domain-containing protein, partial [Anaerospora hongkongensis]